MPKWRDATRGAWQVKASGNCFM